MAKEKQARADLWPAVLTPPSTAGQRSALARGLHAACTCALLFTVACTDIVPGPDRFPAAGDAATSDAAASACATDCDDGQPCTKDTCADGACLNVPLSGGRCLNGTCAPTFVAVHSLCQPDSAALDVGAIGNVTHYVHAGTVPLYVLPPGNLLQNAGAEAGFDQWEVGNGGDSWGISTAYLFGAKSFRSSYEWSSLSQTVDLQAAGYASEFLDAQPPVYVSAFAASTDQKLDFFKLELEFLDAKGDVLDTWSSGEIQAAAKEQSPPAWSVAFAADQTCAKGTRKLRYRLEGKSGEYWQGQFGALHDGLSIAVGKLQVRYSNDQKAWSAWQEYAPVVPAWVLTPEIGPKTVHAQFRDETGATIGKPAEFSVFLVPE